MSEAKFSINVRSGDAQLTVRGDNYNEFTNNLTSIAQDSTFRVDLETFMASAQGTKPTHQQAVQNVALAMPAQQYDTPRQNDSGYYSGPPQQQPEPFAPPQQYQQAPPQQTTNATFACDHGQRQFREGQKKDGGTWQAYFCPSKVCKPVGPNGKPWS